jgi:preprotein translocase subunit SecB
MAEQLDPVFQIQRVYLKEASLEQPNSPAILLEQESPTVDIQLGVNANPVAEGVFEVTVTATVQTKIKDKTVFLAEVTLQDVLDGVPRKVPRDTIMPVVSASVPVRHPAE